MQQHSRQDDGADDVQHSRQDDVQHSRQGTHHRRHVAGFPGPPPASPAPDIVRRVLPGNLGWFRMPRPSAPFDVTIELIIECGADGVSRRLEAFPLVLDQGEAGRLALGRDEKLFELTELLVRGDDEVVVARDVIALTGLGWGEQLCWLVRVA